MQSTKNRTMKCQIAVVSPHLASAEGQYLGHLEPCPGHEQRGKTPRAQCPGSVPALPFGTGDWALVSVPDSSVWLKLPTGVKWEINYCLCEHSALEIWSAAGQRQRTSILQHRQQHKPRLTIRDANIQVKGSPSDLFLPGYSTVQLVSLSRQEKNSFTL